MTEFHQIAGLFPLMEEAALSELAEDIREHGLRDPIWLHEGKIIDGRNRYRACELAGVEPQYQEWDGQGSLTAFVVSLNLKRRHLSTSQRAMVAAKLANMKPGRPSNTSQNCGVSTAREDAAKALNVSPRILDTARTVQEHGTPEEVEAVESGERSVSAVEKEVRERNLPSPRKANERAKALGVSVVASDGKIYSGRAESDIAADVRVTKITYQCARALKDLATMTVTPSEYIKTIPPYCSHEVEDYLDNATDWLQELKQIWRHKNASNE